MHCGWSFDIIIIICRVTNFLPKIVDMLFFFTKKNWISIFWIPLFSGIAGKTWRRLRGNAVESHLIHVASPNVAALWCRVPFYETHTHKKKTFATDAAPCVWGWNLIQVGPALFEEAEFEMEDLSSRIKSRIFHLTEGTTKTQNFVCKMEVCPNCSQNYTHISLMC